MITLETGVPGAGKTLYCVDKLLRPLVGATVKHENTQGDIEEVPRTIYTNTNGLLLDHQKIGPGGEWSYDGRAKAWSQPDGCDKLGLNNWHEWARPGSVIVYDEVQKPWPLAAAGSPVPPCITALETHRHMGVDFIILTQHPMLIHANLVRLVGRHLHIRRMGNLGLAVVYEWDSASRTLLYKNALAKSAYRYNKSVFDLYKSAELHTKQPRRMPSLVFGVLLALGLIGYFAPASYGRIAERINPKPATVKPLAGPSVASAVHWQPGMPVTPPPVPVPVEPVAPAPVASGCIVMGQRCTCFDGSGARMPLAGQACRDASLQVDKISFAGSSVTSVPVGPRDLTPVPPATASSGSYTAEAEGPQPLHRSFAGGERAGPRPGIAP